MKIRKHCTTFAAMMLAESFILSGCTHNSVQLVPVPSTNSVGNLYLYDVAGVAGSAGNGGDGGPAIEAKLYFPQDVLVSGNEVCIVDWNNHVIRKVIPSNLAIGPSFAGSSKGYSNGTGDDVRFAWPIGTDSYPGGKMDIGPDGQDLYVADTENHRIRKVNIASGEVTTIAGTGEAGYSGDDGEPLDARLNQPTDVACTPSGELFIADAANNIIRKIDRNNTISTVVGTGTAGFSIDGTPAQNAMLNRPSGIFWDDATRMLYVCDTFNHQVKKVNLP